MRRERCNKSSDYQYRGDVAACLHGSGASPSTIPDRVGASQTNGCAVTSVNLSAMRLLGRVVNIH